MIKLRTFEQLAKLTEGKRSLEECSSLELIILLEHGAELRDKNKKYTNGIYYQRAVYNNVTFYCKTTDPIQYLKKYTKKVNA